MDKYYIYTFASAPDLTSFVSNAILQWLLWPIRILLEAVFGSPFNVINDIEVDDSF